MAARRELAPPHPPLPLPPPITIYFVALDSSGKFGAKINPLTGNSVRIASAEVSSLLTSGQGIEIRSTKNGAPLELTISVAVPRISTDFVFLRPVNQPPQRRREEIFASDCQSSWYRSELLRSTPGRMSLPDGEMPCGIAEDLLDDHFDVCGESDAICLSEQRQRSIVLTKASLSMMEVMGVFAASFLVCSLPDPDNSDLDLIVLVDQHALHERIRLDDLNNACFGTSPRRVASVALVPAMTLYFPTTQLADLSTLSKSCEKFGVKLASFDLPAQSVAVSRVPTILADRHRSSSDREALRGDLSILIQEILEILTSASTSSFILPPILVNLLSTAACRGAIKFGEAVPVTQLTRLFRAASECPLPFQCAHGRPSMIPILSVPQPRPLPPKKVAWRGFLERSTHTKPIIYRSSH
ncbi:putative DNA mismatch repair protein Mlh3 [Hypsibius exemplaris]|uniref:DNA mismatch repair protein Mlh3 n=1 Tax=Hypsibius exemplaris TaxID=2072580 RepID=A0A9X6NJM3_HYPEX|nr:putative DNA mismatch repair protein Mlh3 [Hypsibius exemplaris]